MELGGVELPRLVGDGREGRALAGGDHPEALGDRRHPIAMAHPHLVALALAPDAVEEGIGGLHLDEGLAELPMVRGLHGAAELGAHGLLAIADAEHGKSATEHGIGGPRASPLMDRGRPARQDDALEARPVEGLFGRLEGHDFRVDARLADPPGDELGDLRAEIDDQNAVLHGERIGQARGVGKRLSRGERRGAA